MQIDPDYENRCCRPSPKRSGRRETIDVDRARQLYDELGTWRAVADKMPRASGQKFTELAIFQAVRWADQGYVGSRS